MDTYDVRVTAPDERLRNVGRIDQRTEIRALGRQSRLNLSDHIANGETASLLLGVLLSGALRAIEQLAVLAGVRDDGKNPGPGYRRSSLPKWAISPTSIAQGKEQQTHTAIPVSKAHPSCR